jgi:triosephosphate isomerase (TIM)
MRRPFVAGNWKMNTTRDEATGLANVIAAAGPGADRDVAVCVPFPHLPVVHAELRHSRVRLGAQHVHWEPSGAFTGEVSISMLEDYCSLVLIGHSERRQYFGETDETVLRRLRAVLQSSLDPIVCIGETLDQRKSGSTEEVLARQVEVGIAPAGLTDRITVAYEPVWAIGTGETATPEIAQESCAFIRAELRRHSGDVADTIRIQYGGSVNPDNAAELLAQPDIDGALVGGASLKADQFLAIVEAASP